MTIVRIRGRLERSDEKWVKDEARKLGVESIKVGKDGWPDRLYLIPGGRPLWIEHKRSAHEGMTRQKRRIEQLREWGYDAELIDDRHEALEAIRRALAAARLPKSRRKATRQ